MTADVRDGDDRVPREEPASSPRQTAAFLKRLFADVGFSLDPRRGQNFLVDLNLLDLLARTAAIRRDDVVLEVGTGTGALTERIAPTAGAVITVEIDRRLAQLAGDRLVDHANVTLIEGDALARKHQLSPALLTALAEALAATGGRLLLVANLPYCVATPVISNLLALPRPFDAAIVTVQREMGERMTATAGTPLYNALSVWVGAQCSGTVERVLPPTVFWPRPKVESAIVRLDLDTVRRGSIDDLHRFHGFVRDVFCHRRKLLRGVLARMAGKRTDQNARETVDRVFGSCGLEPDARAEDIAPAAFVELERQFARAVASPER